MLIVVWSRRLDACWQALHSYRQPHAAFQVLSCSNLGTSQLPTAPSDWGSSEAAVAVALTDAGLASADVGLIAISTASHLAANAAPQVWSSAYTTASSCSICTHALLMSKIS